MESYRLKLLSISNGLTEKELTELKFVCKEHIPVGIIESISRPVELFNELEKRNLLSSTNTDYLQVLLTGINRLELRDALCETPNKGKQD